MTKYPILILVLLSLSDPVSSTESNPTNPQFNADLPPLLTFRDGSPVKTEADWQQRKAEIRSLMMQYFIGSFPSTVPQVLQAEILASENPADGSTRRRVKLTFDTPHQVSMEIRVWIPPGNGPFPLLLTQPRYYQIAWAEMALQRGYAVCLYPGVDSHHQEKEYPGYESVWQTFRREYPETSWTEISTKAWLASRTLDYLLDVKYDYPIIKNQIAIIGFSRYGKQSLIAAAFDERITSVVARSPGSPGSCPYRFTSRNTFAEAPADFPDEWFLPSLRSYTGHENELPMDAHGWLALIAPRRCLIHTAYNDGSEPTFAVERAYLEGRSVYRFLGKPDHLRVLYRAGQHEPITEEQRRQNLDWFDLSFGRGNIKPEEFPEAFIHQFDWQAWKSQQTAADITPPVKKLQSQSTEAEIRSVLTWALGTRPQSTNGASNSTFLSPAESEMMTHDRWQVENTARMDVGFGENIRGNLYYNPTIQKPVPGVIWLHPYSYHSGYNEGYGVEKTTIYHRLAQAGYAVLAYDQCGFGLRLLEGRDFYQNYPHWSRLGRMVADVQAAVDFLLDGKGKSAGTLPKIKSDQIYIVGYSLGGMVGLYATALDSRITGVAAFCGFTPLRTDTDDKPTGGIRRLWQWHALQPLLGLYQGHETDIPYDFEDVLRLITPRPCLLVTPKRDRDADYSDIENCLYQAQAAWVNKGSADAFTHLAPDDINRFQQDQQNLVLRWLKK